MTDREKIGVLAGLRVIELAAFVAVPFAGMTLAQMGADVVRVDPADGPIDRNRMPTSRSGESLYWAGLNKGKRSAVLDLSSEKGRKLFRDLVASETLGGILITNLNPSWLHYEELTSQRNDLIMVQVIGNPDGSTAVDYTVNASVGFPFVTGNGDSPVNHLLPAWDLIAGNTVVSATLAAERHRMQTGRGQKVTIALSDIAMAVTGALGFIAEVQVNDADRPAYGNYLYGAYGADFETLDHRRVMVVAITDRQWSALVRATQSGDVIAKIARLHDRDLNHEHNRFKLRHEISNAFAPWFRQRTLDEIRGVLDSHRVCWSPYQTFRQMVEDDPRCSIANPLFNLVRQPGIGEYLTPGSPALFGGGSRVPVRPAPRFGEHTRSILEEAFRNADS